MNSRQNFSYFQFSRWRPSLDLLPSKDLEEDSSTSSSNSIPSSSQLASSVEPHGTSMVMLLISTLMFIYYCNTLVLMCYYYIIALQYIFPTTYAKPQVSLTAPNCDHFEQVSLTVLDFFGCNHQS